MAGKTLTGGNPSRHALRALGIFGSVRSLTLLFSVIKVKLVAVWLGAEGMGLFNILNSATDTVSSLSQLGIGSSAVKNIASASDKAQVQRLALAVRRLTWLSGVAGAFLMLILAESFSSLTFGDTAHASRFRWLAVSVFLSAVTNGWLAVTQGTGELKQLARAQLWGAVASFVISVPLFYFYRIEAVLPVLTLGFAVSAMTAWIFRARVGRPEPLPRWTDSLREGGAMVRLGFMMTVSVFVGLAVNYLMTAWLNEYASTAIVGYYNAGYTLATRYTGILFAALATEYYPRLSGIIGSQSEVERHVSAQIRLGVRILLPVILLFIAFDRIVVTILYSPDFEVILPYVTLAVAATLFRLAGWCYSYVILAHGDGSVYAMTELAGHAVWLITTICGYTLYGMAGFGYAMILSLLFDACITWCVYRYRYGYRTDSGTFRLMAVSVAVAAATLIFRAYTGPLPVMFLSVPVIFFSLRGISQSLKQHSRK